NELFTETALFGADARLEELALYGGNEPGEVALDDEVAGARPQDLDGCVLADRARDNDDGQVGSHGHDDGQSRQGIECRHGKVRDGDLPRAVPQRGAK